MSERRFLVPADQLRGDRAIVQGNELHHMRVRRLRTGAAVVLTDGCGRERRGSVIKMTQSHAIIALSDFKERHTNESPLQLTLALASVKPAKVDLVIEKTVELGVSRIIMFTSRRCITEPSAERMSRWRRIAETAAKQSQRANVPEILGPSTFQQVLQFRAHLRLLFWEAATIEATWPQVETATMSDVVAVVGPAGGFTDSEGRAAMAAGFCSIGLGPRVLRTETAAIAAIVLCQQRWGDMP